MRVALVTNLVPHYRRRLFEELGKRLDLTLILTSSGNEWYWQGDPPFDAGSIDAKAAASPLRVARALRGGDYDAVVCGLTGRATLLAAVGTARALRLPFVVWVGIWEHPHTLAHRFSRPIARALYRSADAIVTYGGHVSAFVATEGGRTDRVFVAPQAVENEWFRAPVPPEVADALRVQLDLSSGVPTITFVGRVTEEKGLDYLIEACARITVPLQLVIAGTGPLLRSMGARVSALGISDRVRFAGQVAQTDLPALLRVSDVLVLPSVSTKRVRETWGLVVNEAMNSGLPVVATDAVGAAAGGLVVNQKTGLIVPQRDAVALAAALEDLAAHEAKRRKLGANARDHVLSWNYGAAADAFEAALAAAGA